MKNKKQMIISDINIELKKIMVFLTFVFLTLFFSCLPAMAEETKDEMIITISPEKGGDLPEDLPINLYYNSDGISLNNELPDSVNLSLDKYFPPIRNQQGGSCTAWATTYYQFTYQVAKLNNWDAKHDDSKVFSPKYVWNYLNGGADNGISRIDSYRILKMQGSLRWTEFPQNDLSFDWYRGSNETEISALRNALKTRISKYDYYNFAIVKDNPTPITSNKDTDLVHMKKLLNDGYVLSVSTDCNIWKKGRLFDKEEKCIVSGEGTTGGHALTIVGYDDKIECDFNHNKTIEEYEKGAFLVANSWGTNAKDHNNGYIWLMYDALNEKSFSGNTQLNTADRHRFLRANQYYYIDVENYEPKLMAEVTVEQKYRNDFFVAIGNSNSLSDGRNTRLTFLNKLGGEKSFDGSTNGYQTCTFVFDYDTLYDADNKVYWVDVSDSKADNAANTTVKKIRWIDKNGNVLKTLNQQATLNGERGSYYYGIPVKSITLNKTSSTLYKGESEVLTATALPENATDKKVEWTSSAPSVVRVDSESGKVIYVGTGTAVVTATATDGSGVSASCTYRITDDYYNTRDKAFLIAMHTKTSGAINTSGDVDFFKFTPTATGTYLIYTTGTTDTLGYLYDASQNQLMQNDDSSLSGRNFALKYTLEAGKTYYIKVGGYGTNTGAYTLNISKDFYSASLASLNQDARRVQMQAEAATALTTLKLTIGNKTYTLNRPGSGNLDTTVNGARFKVTFVESNNGLSTIWKIEACIPATTGGGDTVSFDFSKGTVANVKSPAITGLIAYESVIKTGVNVSAKDSLSQLLTAMQQSGNTLTVRNRDNILVNVTSVTRAATGMKIIETDRNGWIMKIHYLVVFGDVTGDGMISTSDGLAILDHTSGAKTLEAIARIAADVDHDGIAGTNDALKVNKYVVGNGKIDQNYTITDVPDDCYYLDSVAF